MLIPKVIPTTLNVSNKRAPLSYSLKEVSTKPGEVHVPATEGRELMALFDIGGTPTLFSWKHCLRILNKQIEQHASKKKDDGDENRKPKTISIKLALLTQLENSKLTNRENRQEN
jgi:hypothetical protein